MPIGCSLRCTPVELERLQPSFERVRLALGQIIYNQVEPIRDAYFLEGGTVSLLLVTEDGLSIEVAIVGNEGMVGFPSAFGIDTTLYQTVVQVEGSALKIPARTLRNEFMKTRSRGGTTSEAAKLRRALK